MENQIITKELKLYFESRLESKQVGLDASITKDIPALKDGIDIIEGASVRWWKKITYSHGKIIAESMNISDVVISFSSKDGDVFFVTVTGFKGKNCELSLSKLIGQNDDGTPAVEIIEQGHDMEVDVTVNSEDSSLTPTALNITEKAVGLLFA